MEIEIRIEHRDHHHGQDDFILLAARDGLCVGSIEFTLYQGDVSVSMIEVKPEFRRNGIATAMIVHLQQLYPSVPIDFGFASEEGAVFLSSLPWEIVENETRAIAVRRLDAITQTLSKYARAIEDCATPEGKRALIETMDDWNALDDEADDLRRLISVEPTNFRFVSCAPSKASTPASSPRV